MAYVKSDSQTDDSLKSALRLRFSTTIYKGAKMQRASAIALFAGAMICVLTQFSPQATDAAATPIPGGANQLNGISGGLASTLFNGKVRIRKMTIRTATALE